MKRFIVILSVLALLAACSRMDKDNGPVHGGEAGQIMLRTMTKAEGMGSVDDKPVFIFWLDGDHTKFGTEEVLPYFVSYPQGTVDDYKSTPYNTGYPYPGNMTVYACGYNPSHLEMEEGDGIYSWTSLTVPEGMHGYVDITGTQAFVQGSQESPFETDDAQTMKFHHLQSKVNFTARLGDIPAERYFRAVKITVNGNGVFTDKVAWNNTNTAWEASETVSSDVFWSATDPNTNQMDPNEVDPRSIGSVYIHPGKKQIVFDVEVEMSETVTFDSSETIKTTATVVFENDITLNAGDEYDINITILYDSFVIKGNKAKWQDGGKIPLPFYPNN